MFVGVKFLLLIVSAKPPTGFSNLMTDFNSTCTFYKSFKIFNIGFGGTLYRHHKKIVCCPWVEMVMPYKRRQLT